MYRRPARTSLFKLSADLLESRDNPSTGLFAVGADTPGGPRVTVYNPNGSVRYDFLAYPSTVTSGVRVATGDVTGDGVEDIITVPGAGGGPDVRVWNGASAGSTPALAYNFLAFNNSDQRGVFLAVGDVNRDGRNDIVASGLFGSTPYYRVFSGVNNAVIQQTQLPVPVGGAYNDPFTVAAGDMNQDGYADIAVGSPYCHLTANDVLVYNGVSGALSKTFATSGTPGNWNNIQGPVYTFVSIGNLNGTGGSELVMSSNQSSPPSSGLPGKPVLSPAVISIYDPTANVTVTYPSPYGSSFSGQVRVTTGDVNGDGKDDLIFGAGPGGGPRVVAKSYLNSSVTYRDFFAFGGTFYGGLFVG